MRSILIISFCLISAYVLSQDYSDKVRSLQKGAVSPPAKIADVSWVAGHWKGEAFGGVVEEIWSPPSGGAMMCAFRHISEGQTKFYELCTLLEEEGSLMLRLKHFNADLTGWEEKAETVEFPFISLEGNRAYFDGFTFELLDEDHLNIYVLINQGGDENVMQFAYIKVR